MIINIKPLYFIFWHIFKTLQMACNVSVCIVHYALLETFSIVVSQRHPVAAVFDAPLEHLFCYCFLSQCISLTQMVCGEVNSHVILCSSGLYLLLLLLCYFVLLFQSFPGASELSFSELMLCQPLHPCLSAVPCWSPLIPAFSHFISAPSGRTPALFQTYLIYFV